MGSDPCADVLRFMQKQGHLINVLMYLFLFDQHVCKKVNGLQMCLKIAHNVEFSSRG